MSEKILVWEERGWRADRIPDMQKDFRSLMELQPEFATRKPYPGIPYIPYEWSDVVHDNDTDIYSDRPTRYIESEHGRLYLYGSGQFRSTQYNGRYAYFPLIVPRSEQGWAMQAPEPGYLVYDLLSDTATVYDEDDTEKADLQLSAMMENRSPNSLVEMAKKKMARRGLAIWPTKVYAVNHEHFPWPVKENHIGSAFIRNDQVSVPLVGSVVDTETEEIVYAHMAGHAGNVQSIMATFNTSHRKHIHLITSLGNLHAYSSSNYKTYNRQISDRVVSTILVDTRCLEQQVNDYGYLIRPRDEAGIDPGEAFAARLNSVLTIPILPEWGQILLEEGTEGGLARQITAAGDIFQAYAISRNNGWIELVERLLTEGTIEIPQEVN